MNLEEKLYLAKPIKKDGEVVQDLFEHSKAARKRARELFDKYIKKDKISNDGELPLLDRVELCAAFHDSGKMDPRVQDKFMNKYKDIEGNSNE